RVGPVPGEREVLVRGGVAPDVADLGQPAFRATACPEYFQTQAADLVIEMDQDERRVGVGDRRRAARPHRVRAAEQGVAERRGGRIEDQDRLVVPLQAGVRNALDLPAPLRRDDDESAVLGALLEAGRLGEGDVDVGARAGGDGYLFNDAATT